MCSVVILRRPGHAWPLILGANRDELGGRPWQAPGRHWPERPHVIAGLDETAGGSWMGVNDDGLAACVLNRMGSLGPAPGKRSRGELVLDALDHASAREAAEALASLDPAAFRSFNLLIADVEAAFWLKHSGEPGGTITLTPLPDGISMMTAHDLNDTTTKRIARYLPKFRAAEPPDPTAGAWQSWESLLAERDQDDPFAGMAVGDDSGFGTVSSSLLAIPALASVPTPWRFAPGAPDRVAFSQLALGS